MWMGLRRPSRRFAGVTSRNRFCNRNGRSKSRHFAGAVPRCEYSSHRVSRLTGFLSVQLGNFARTTSISAERVRREVALSNCLVTSWRVTSFADVNKLSKDRFSEGELLELSVRERTPGEVLWNEEPEKIGIVDADRMCGHVILPPHAFAPIWSAAEATDGRRRNVELELKARQSEILSVTNVGFFEAMLQGNTVAKGEPTQPLDPVLVELREMRKELIPLIRYAIFWFFVALGLLGFFLIWRLSAPGFLHGGIPIRCQFADHPPKGISLVITCLSNPGPTEVKGRLYAAISSTDSAMPVAKRANAIPRARRLSL